MGKKKRNVVNKTETEFTPSFLSLKNPHESNNGLYLNHTYIPEEVILYILSFSHPEYLLSYSLVCHKWNKLIKSYTMWSIIYERKYNRKAKKLPWYLYCCVLSTNYFDTNLLLNGNGQNGLNNWECKVWDGDKYIEDIPLGAEPLPINIPEFNNKTSCFATSYFAGYKVQFIKFGKNKLFQYILNNYKPHIYLSEWTTGRLDCGCEYILQCGFVGENQSQMSVPKPLTTHLKSQWEEAKWNKVELVVTEYPEGIEGITFENNGYNTHPWKGHYGIKMAGGVVKVLFNSIESLPVDSNGKVKPKRFSKIQYIPNKLPETEVGDNLEDVWNGEYNDEIYYFMT